jgi:hypothetical protein
LTSPANTNVLIPEPIAGSVLPIQRAEELLSTLPGVISCRIVAGGNGAVDEIHLLTSEEIAPKQTVRNVESALMAHLGMRVSHKKISVATSSEPGRAGIQRPAEEAVPSGPRRTLYFEDLEVRRSRTRGVACRVTLRRGEQSYVGEAEGVENDRQRIELAARATLAAIAESGEERPLALEGCKMVEAFEREFVLAAVTTRFNREIVLLTGTAEVKDTAETASVLAVLDATNRWIDYSR